MVSRFIYLGICGLFLAGIIHICIVLLIPSFGSRDAARQISENTEPYKFKRINATSGISIANSDPFFKYSVCPFNLTEAAIQVNGENMPDFWSVAVFDEGGQVIYSLNDRTAINKALRVIVVNSMISRWRICARCRLMNWKPLWWLKHRFRPGLLCCGLWCGIPALRNGEKSFYKRLRAARFPPARAESSRSLVVAAFSDP